MKKLSRVWIEENVVSKFDELLLPDLLMLKEILYAKDLQEEIKNCLKSFQNSDGGFKGFLEPDIQSDKSTMIATSVALSIYYYLGEIEESVALKLSTYLEKHYNKEEQRWNIVSNDIENDPHAFWWNKDIEPTFGYVNPSASIVAYVEALNIPLSNTIKKEVHENISKLDKMEDIHDYACLDVYYQLMGSEVPYFVLDGALKLMSTDISEWNTYVAKPLDVITGPSHPLYSKNKAIVDDHLDYLIDELMSKNVISPTWTWGQFESHFDKATRMWQQRLTYKAIEQLYKFGRIE